MKKTLSVIMSVILIILPLSISAFAIHNDTLSEDGNVFIDGEYFHIEESYINGAKTVCMTNLSTGNQEYVYYNKEEGTVYHNDIPIAFIDNLISNNVLSHPSTYRSVSTGWVKKDTSWYNISWGITTLTRVVAAAIAVVIPKETTLGVITKMGLSALSTLAESCTGGSIRCITYTLVLLDGSVRYRYDWTFFAPTGEGYGPYSTYDL